MKRIFLFVAILFSLLKLAFAEEACYPTVDKSLPQYLIGYGSLIQQESKAKTYPHTGPNLPIEVQGYKRGWFGKGGSVGFSTTFLSVVEDTSAKFNGVLFRVPSQNAINNYDQRESIYCRQEVKAQNITMLNQQALPKGQYWLYVAKPETVVKATKQHPIVQSYVDIFLSGCIEIQNKYHLKNYLNNCIESTYDWPDFWVNDRLHPRRPMADQPYALMIDDILSQKLPRQFAEITIE